MKDLYNKYKKFLIVFALVIFGALFGVYIIKKTYTHNDDSVKDYKMDIVKEKQKDIVKYQDSLRVLKQDNYKLDSVILKNKELDKKLQTKEVIVRDVYHEKIKYVDRYNNGDIDAYFNNRYGNDTNIPK